jgi:glutathione S-transferase
VKQNRLNRDWQGGLPDFRRVGVYLDFRFGDLSWRDGHPRLAAWHAAFDARPSVVANPPVDDR